MDGITLNSRFLQNAAIAFIAIFIATKIISVILNPLNKFPGPKISKWTDLRFKYELLRGKRAQYIHSLHKQYGPVVRINPSHVSTSDPVAVKEIYKVQSQFIKSSWYLKMTAMPPITLFTMLDRKQHADRRRILANGMSETHLKKLEPYVHEKVDLTMNGMKNEMSRQGFTDVWLWWICFATDVIGDLSFGESFRTLEHGKRSQYVKDLEERPLMNTMRVELPWVKKLLPWIPKFRNILESGKRLQGYAEQSFKRYSSLVESDPTYSKPTLFTKLTKSHDAGDLTDFEMYMEGLSYIIAGSDTTATTLTYMTWEIARRPELQKALRSEIANLPNDVKASDVKDLPLLNQVMKETLRLYTAAGSSLPRITPPEGLLIGDHLIPGGTEISTQAYTLHRNEEIFPNSEEFIPSRWEKTTPQMKEAWMPFGGGSRICIGQYLAQIEIRLGIVHLLRTFPEKIEIADGAGMDPSASGHQKGMSDDDMEVLTYFLSAPKGHRCLIRGV